MSFFNKGFDDKNSNPAFLTDFDRTKFILWDRYYGMLDNFSRLSNFLYFNKMNKVYLGGFYRYALDFFLFCRPFFYRHSFNKEMNKKIFDYNFSSSLLCVDDLYSFIVDSSNVKDFRTVIFLMNVATDFLHITGLMNITYERTGKSKVASSQEF